MSGDQRPNPADQSLQDHPPRLSAQADAAVIRLARLLGRQMAREAFEARQNHGRSAHKKPDGK